MRLSAKNKYVNRLQQKAHAEATKPEESYKLTPYDDIFKTDILDHLKDEEIEVEKEVKKVKKQKKKFKKNVKSVKKAI